MSEKRFRKSISKKVGSLNINWLKRIALPGTPVQRSGRGNFQSKSIGDLKTPLSSYHPTTASKTPVLIFTTGHKADLKWDSFIRGMRGLIFQNPQITVDRIAAIDNHPPQAQFLWRLEISLVAAELSHELTFRIWFSVLPASCRQNETLREGTICRRDTGSTLEGSP